MVRSAEHLHQGGTKFSPTPICCPKRGRSTIQGSRQRGRTRQAPIHGAADLRRVVLIGEAAVGTRLDHQRIAAWRLRAHFTILIFAARARAATRRRVRQLVPGALGAGGRCVGQAEPRDNPLPSRGSAGPVDAPVATRRPNGTLLPGPGACLNPGGRPRNQIEELRAKYSHRLPEFMDRLIELSKSPNETIQLQAIRELLDRLIGKPVAVVESTHTGVDVASMYLQALKQANGVPDSGGNTINGAAESPKH
jgi:hypothetical protein